MIESVLRLNTVDVLTGGEFSRAEIESILDTAAMLKRDPQSIGRPMEGRSLVMLFEKPSLRTRVSFEIGMARLGGHAVYLDQQSARIGQREPIGDFGRNLERWTDVVVARTFSHDTIAQLAEACRVPVINALSDLYHPCQALADVMTIAEQCPGKPWNSIRLAYIGDGNNVCHSLLLVASTLGLNVTVITPKGYEPRREIVNDAMRRAMVSGSTITVTDDAHAVEGHDAIYTDTWVSMGEESQAERKLRDFARYQVTHDMMTLAGPDARFMHCLPAYRGKEVAAHVIDSPSSVVFDQAENRMHAQNALLLHLLAAESRLGGAAAWPDVLG
jgi:ornithine carbamoyltransferase